MEQFDNLPLVNTLCPSKYRSVKYDSSHKDDAKASARKGGSGEEGGEDAGAPVTNTVPDPFSFFEKDMEFIKRKFDPHNQDRAKLKRNFQKKHEQTCHTGNTNVHSRNLNSSLDRPIGD